MGWNLREQVEAEAPPGELRDRWPIDLWCMEMGRPRPAIHLNGYTITQAEEIGGGRVAEACGTL